MPTITLIANRLVPGEPVSFGLENGDLSVGRGWSEPEAGFRWTDGPISEIQFALDEPVRSGRLVLNCIPYTYGALEAQNALFFVNGWLAAIEELRGPGDVALELHDLAGVFNLAIYAPTAKSPAELGVNPNERRRLGLMVYSATLLVDAPALLG